MDAFDELGDLGKSRKDPLRISLRADEAAAVPPVAWKKTTLEEFPKKSLEWGAVQEELNGLNETDFKFSTMPHTQFNDLLVPLVNGSPSLLLYGLTAEGRYNGAAEKVRKHL